MFEGGRVTIGKVGVLSLAVALSFFAFAPSAAATPTRVAIFCDQPQGPVWVNGDGFRCGVNLTQQISGNCTHVVLGVYHCEEVFGPGNVLLVGVAVDSNFIPGLCGGAGGCYGQNAGIWMEDSSYSWGCFAWTETPGPDPLRVCMTGDANGHADSLCIITVLRTICTP